jgi:hypothetical protein
MSTLDNPLVEILKSRYEEIKKALQDGRQVFIGTVQVKTVELKATRRSMVMIVNNGELFIYPSQLRAYRVVIV